MNLDPQAPSAKKRCFIIGPPDEDDKSESRTKWILETVDNELNRRGYTTVHVNTEKIPGLRMAEIQRHLTGDDIVIADLAGGHPDVYYLLAARHMLGKPTIELADKGKALPPSCADLKPIRVDLEKQVELGRSIGASVEKTEREDFEFSSPLSNLIYRLVLEKSGEDKEKNSARFFDSLTEKINVQFAELQKLTRYLEDSMRKPLHGIDEVFVHLYEMLKNAKKGGRIWFVGMTLGLGPPHKYRISKAPALSRSLRPRPIHGKVGEGSYTMDDLFSNKWKAKSLPKFEKMIEELHEMLGGIVEIAHEPVVVCLTNNKRTLKEKFLNKLIKRTSYETLEPDIDKVAAEIMDLHNKLAGKAPEGKPIRYVDSIPLQILIVERENAPLALGKRACVVFHVGTGNIQTDVLEDGETGFYTEVDSVVEMFETMAESLWEAGSPTPGKPAKTE
jgi:hypothetical protein